MTSTIFLQRLVFAFTLSGIVLSPAAFGGAPAWFTSIYGLFAGTLGLIWAATTLFRPDRQPASIRPIVIPVFLFTAVVAWSYFQAWAGIGPDLAHEAWGEARALTGKSTISPLTLNTEASTNGAMRLTMYGLVFLLCYQFGTDEKRALKMLCVLAGGATLYAGYGLYLETFRTQSVLWYDRTFEQGNLSSTFPNRNAFASYAALSLVCCCALLYRRRVRPTDLAGHWSSRLAAILHFFLPRNGWVLLACIILFWAILLTHSRAGLLATLVGVTAFLVCASWGIRFRRLALSGGIGILTVVGVLFVIGGGGTSERFGKLQSAGTERIEIYRLTLEAIADRPFLGTGLGTFSDVFPAYRSAALRPAIDFAHNSYLENMLELGIPAATAFYGGFFMLLLIFVRALLGNASAQPYPALGIAILTAAAIHAGFDYAIQFPAVSILIAAAIGIATAQSLAPRIGEDNMTNGINDRRA